MGLLRHQKYELGLEIGIWTIEEEESYFLDQLSLTGNEHKTLAIKKGSKRLEWLASRWLLHLMSERDQRLECAIDEHGKPFLLDSAYQISLSHSGNLTAVIAAPFSVGIDIQKIVPKISRIAPKFMRAIEMKSLAEDTRIEHLHVYWGAKEALYKAYGKRQIDFKEHLLVAPFKYDLNIASTHSKIIKPPYQAKYNIQYEKIDDYILVYAYHRNDDQPDFL